MSVASLHDWSTPRAFLLPELGPGVTGELRQALEQALRRIAADPSVQALVLFGSRACGSARPDSDLDLLVVERTPQEDALLPHHSPALPAPPPPLQTEPPGVRAP